MTTTHLSGGIQSERGDFLRRVIQWDAGILTALGIVLLFVGEPVAAFMGLPNANIVTYASVGLLLYDGSRLLWSMMGERIDRRLVNLSLYGNAIWAIASIPLLVANLLPLSDGGWWVMAGLADYAAVFAILQWVGLRREAH